MNNENTKNLTKRSIDQSKLAGKHYSAAVSLMHNKEYTEAIIEFKAAMKRYKRAKLSEDALNFIRANMALSYAKTGNNEDRIVGERLLNLITSTYIFIIYRIFHLFFGTRHNRNRSADRLAFPASIFRNLD